MARNSVWLLLLSFFLLLFFLLSQLYETPYFVLTDTYVSSWINLHLSEALLPFFIIITTIGSIKVTQPLLLIIVIYFILKRKYYISIVISVYFYAVRFFNSWLKELFSRERPDLEFQLMKEFSYSFPSGHSMNSIAFYGLLCWILIHYFHLNHGVKILTFLTFTILIILIGISRIFLNVHYATDVIGGFLAGGSCLIVILQIFYIYQRRSTN